MNANTALEVATPLTPTSAWTTEDGATATLAPYEAITGDRLQDALDEIAVLHGRLDEKTETIGVAFGAIAELYARIERLEAGQHT